MRLPHRRLLVAAATVAALTSAAACGAPTGSAPGSSDGAPAAAAQAGLTSTPLRVPAGMDAEPFDRVRTVLVPPGWTMAVWARIPKARLAAWTPDGALLVSVPSDGRVLRLDRKGATSTVLLDGLDQPHGMAFDGNVLYVAESDQIDAYDYAGGRVGAGRTTVVAGLPDAKSAELGGAYAHALKSVLVGPDHALYFSIGSSGNISGDDRDASPQRATVMRVPPGGGAAAVFARGVRNGTGLALAPDGSVWTAVNNRDNIQYPRDDGFAGASGSSRGEVIPLYVADHPPEELARLTAGRDLGWPFCNPDPDAAPGRTDSADTDHAPVYTRDVETNPDGSDLDCARLAPIERTFGAHSAPLGLTFTDALPAPYQAGALVGVHGSWNRQPPRAPEVSFFPWADGTLGAQRTLVGGFQAPDGSRWGRPVAAVVGPDGAVYVTDDEAGAVYRLAPPGR